MEVTRIFPSPHRRSILKSPTLYKLAAGVHTLAVVVLASGCASPVVQSKATHGSIESGLVYALPKAQILLQASRRKVDAAEVEAAKKDADDYSAVAKLAATSAKEAEQQWKAVESELSKADEIKVGTDAIADVRRRRDLAKVSAALAKTKADTAAAVAKKARDAYEMVHGRIEQWIESGSLTPQAPAPDSSRRYVAMHAASAWRDDALTLNVVDGMLSTSESKTTGQGANIILNLLRSVAALGVSSAPRPARSTSMFLNSGTRGTRAGADEDCKAYDLAFVFDPTDPDSLSAAQKRLIDNGSNLKLSDIGFPSPAVGAPSGPSLVAATTAKLDGLVYRVTRRMNLELARAEPKTTLAANACTPNGLSTPARITVSVPDATTLYVLPVTGAAMTKSSTKYVFKDGMPTELSLDEPSALAAVAGLPVDIVKALVSIPGEIIKLRVDYSTQEKAELDGQVKLIEAQISLLKAQRDLQAAQESDRP